MTSSEDSAILRKLARSTPRTSASTGSLLWLLLGLALFLFCFALPVLAIVWAVIAYVGTFGIAEILEQTRGLEPATYRIAFWIVALFTGVMLALELRQTFRRRENGRGLLFGVLVRPSLLLPLLAIPTSMLVKLDMGGTDVPDLITTTLLLGALGYIYVILPLAALLFLFRVTRLCWWGGHGANLTARFVGTVGVILGSIVPVVCALEDDADSYTNSSSSGSQALDRALEELEDDDLVEGTHDALAELASSVPPGQFALPIASRPIDGDYRRFDECIETLASSRPGLDARREVIALLSRRYALDPATAEDIAQQKALDVCLHHAQSARADLIPYFMQSAKNATKNEYRNHHNRQACLVSYGAQVDARVSNPWSPSRVDDFLQFTSLMCQLDDTDRQLMQLVGEGHTAREIKQTLGLSSEAAVRQRKKRAMKRLMQHVTR